MAEGKLSHTVSDDVLYFPADSMHTPVTFKMLTSYTGRRQMTLRYMLFVPSAQFGSTRSFSLPDTGQDAKAAVGMGRPNVILLLSMMCACHYMSDGIRTECKTANKTTMIAKRIWEERTDKRPERDFGYMFVLLENLVPVPRDEDGERQPMRGAAGAGPVGAAQRFPRVLDARAQVNVRRCKTMSEYFSGHATDSSLRVHQLEELREKDNLRSISDTIKRGARSTKVFLNAPFGAKEAVAWAALDKNGFWQRYRQAVTWYTADPKVMQTPSNAIPFTNTGNHPLRPDNVFTAENAIAAMDRAGVPRPMAEGGLLLSLEQWASRWSWGECLDSADEKKFDFFGKDAYLIDHHDAYFSVFRSHLMPHVQTRPDQTSVYYQEFCKRMEENIPADVFTEEQRQEFYQRQWFNMHGNSTQAAKSLDEFKKAFAPIIKEVTQNGTWADFDRKRQEVASQLAATLNTDIYKDGPPASFARFLQELESKSQNLCGSFAQCVEDAQLDPYFSRVRYILNALEAGYRTATVHRHALTMRDIMLLDSTRDDDVEHFLSVVCGGPAVSKSYLLKFLDKISVRGAITAMSRETMLASTTDGPREGYAITVDELNPLVMGVKDEERGDGVAKAAREGGGSGPQSNAAFILQKMQTTVREMVNFGISLDEHGRRNEVVTKSAQWGNKAACINVPSCLFLPAMASRAFLFEVPVVCIPGRDIVDRRVTPQTHKLNDRICTLLYDVSSRVQMQAMLWNFALSFGAIRPVQLLLAETLANLTTHNMKERGIHEAREPRRFPKYVSLVRCKVLERAFDLTFNMGLGGPDPTRQRRDSDMFLGEHFFVANLDLSVYAFETDGLWMNPVLTSVLEAVYLMADEHGIYDPSKKKNKDLPVSRIFTSDINDAVEKNPDGYRSLATEIVQHDEYIRIKNLFMLPQHQESGSTNADGSYQPESKKNPNNNNGPKSETAKIMHLAHFLLGGFMRHEKHDPKAIMAALIQLMYQYHIEIDGCDRAVLVMAGQDVFFHKDFIQYHANDPIFGMLRMICANEPRRRKIMRFKNVAKRDGTKMYHVFEEAFIGGGIYSKEEEKKYADAAGRFKSREISEEDAKTSEAARWQQQYNKLRAARDDCDEKLAQELEQKLEITQENERKFEFGLTGTQEHHDTARRIIRIDDRSRYTRVTADNKLDSAPLSYSLSNPDYVDPQTLEQMIQQKQISRSDSKQYSKHKFIPTGRINEDQIHRDSLVNDRGVLPDIVDNHYAMPIHTKRCARVHRERQVICDEFAVLIDQFRERHAAQLLDPMATPLDSTRDDMYTFIRAGLKAAVAQARRFCVYHLHHALKEELTEKWMTYELETNSVTLFLSDASNPSRKGVDAKTAARFVDFDKAVFAYCKTCIDALKYKNHRATLYGLKQETLAVVKSLEVYFAGIATSGQRNSSWLLSNDQKSSLLKIQLDLKLLRLQHGTWPISEADAREIKRLRMQEAMWHPVRPEYKGEDSVTDGTDPFVSEHEKRRRSVLDSPSVSRSSMEESPRYGSGGAPAVASAPKKKALPAPSQPQQLSENDLPPAGTDFSAFGQMLERQEKEKKAVVSHSSFNKPKPVQPPPPQVPGVPAAAVAVSVASDEKKAESAPAYVDADQDQEPPQELIDALLQQSDDGAPVHALGPAAEPAPATPVVVVVEDAAKEKAAASDAPTSMDVTPAVEAQPQQVAESAAVQPSPPPIVHTVAPVTSPPPAGAMEDDAPSKAPEPKGSDDAVLDEFMAMATAGATSAPESEGTDLLALLARDDEEAKKRRRAEEEDDKKNADDKFDGKEAPVDGNRYFESSDEEGEKKKKRIRRRGKLSKSKYIDDDIEEEAVDGKEISSDEDDDDDDDGAVVDDDDDESGGDSPKRQKVDDGGSRAVTDDISDLAAAPTNQQPEDGKAQEENAEVGHKRKRRQRRRDEDEERASLMRLHEELEETDAHSSRFGAKNASLYSAIQNIAELKEEGGSEPSASDSGGSQSDAAADELPVSPISAAAAAASSPKGNETKKTGVAAPVASVPAAAPTVEESRAAVDAALAFFN